MSDKMWDILRFLRPSPEEELINALNNKEKMNMDSQLLKGIEAQIDKVEEDVRATMPDDETLYPSIQEDGAKLIPISEDEYSPLIDHEHTSGLNDVIEDNESETARVILDELVEIDSPEPADESSQNVFSATLQDEIFHESFNEVSPTEGTQEEVSLQEGSEEAITEEVLPTEEPDEILATVSVETLHMEDEVLPDEGEALLEHEITNAEADERNEEAPLLMPEAQEPQPLATVSTGEDDEQVERADAPDVSPFMEEKNAFQPLELAVEENIALQEELFLSPQEVLAPTDEVGQNLDSASEEVGELQNDLTADAREDGQASDAQEAARADDKSVTDEKEGLELLLTADIGLPTEETIGRGRQLKEIPLDEIIPNPYQPRLIMVEEDITELAESIREVGVLQPILVRRAEIGYELIAGERRFRAAKEVGLTTIPALIADVDPLEQQLIALVENLQRKNLSAVEEGRCLQDILSKTHWSQTELAKRLGRSQAAVANKIRLLKLDSVVQQWVMEGKLGERQARTLLSFDPEEQKELGFQAIEQELSVKALEAIAAAKLAQKSHPEKKTSGRASKKKTAPNRDLIQDVAELVSQHRDKGTVAEWKVCEMTEKSVLIEIRIDLTKKEQNEANG